MLATKAPARLHFPLLASPKFDGQRCVIRNGRPLSRNLKPIRNGFTHDSLAQLELEGLDGELIVGHPYASDVWNVTSSGVNSAEGEPDFRFYVFDYTDSYEPYINRLDAVENIIRASGHPRLIFVDHTLLNNQDELDEYESGCVARGYEGVMLRKINGPYKYGRSTAQEGYLLKVKRFEDHEATLVGYEKLRVNENEQTRDERGYAKRSKAKDGLVEVDKVGKLICRFTDESLPTGSAEFKVGTGLTDADRIDMFIHWHNYAGRAATIKHQGFTPDGEPRFPSYKGLRLDLT